MKKEYKTPEAKKVEFDYRENVVASGASSMQGDDKCSTYTDPCTGETKSYEWWETLFSAPACNR